MPLFSAWGWGLQVGLLIISDSDKRQPFTADLRFAGLMLLITKITNRYTEHTASGSSEEYTSASRSLKPGLVASGIVSAGAIFDVCITYL